MKFNELVKLDRDKFVEANWQASYWYVLEELLEDETI